MWTRVLVASAVVAIMGSTLVYGQSADSSDRGMSRDFERPRFSADDFSAFMDARIAGMKAGLRLTPDQEKNWPAFEEAYRNLAKMRIDRMLAARDQTRPPPPSDMLDAVQRRADALSRTAAAYRQIADATAPLYRSLDDAQQRRLVVLAPMLRRMQQYGWSGQGYDPRGQERDRQRRGDRPRFGEGGSRPGIIERIGYTSHEIDHDDAAAPGVGTARENGWQ